MSENNSMEVIKIWIDINYIVGDALPDMYYIAEQVGFSRNVVREVIRCLGVFGAVEVSHGKRTIYKKDVFSCEEHY